MDITAKNNSPEIISDGQLRQIMPNAPKNMLNKFLEEFNKQLPTYQISSPLRISAFIAQGAHESGELRYLIENMNYSAARIIQVWPSRFHSLDAAHPFEHNPEKLGDSVYANRMGNGSPETGDGYKYRGRGWFNGTGKGFYSKMAQLTSIDFIGNPDLLAMPHYAVLSACMEWKSGNMNALADAQNFKLITKKINGGYIGLAERTQYYNKAKKILRVTQN